MEAPNPTGDSPEDNSPEDNSRADRVLRSRRVLLGALPLLAVAGAAACSPNSSTDNVEKILDAAGPPPRPADPDAAVAALMEGNARFVARTPKVRQVSDIEVLWTKQAAGQAPFATVLGCADSRLAPELIFDQFVGDIFVVREAGNIADSPTSLGSLEFSQKVLGSKAIVVLGHSSCGAVQAAFDGAEPGGNIQAVVDAIRPGVAGAADLDAAIADNVRAVIERIRAKSSVLAEAERSGACSIVGAVYDLASARVNLL